MLRDALEVAKLDKQKNGLSALMKPLRWIEIMPSIDDNVFLASVVSASLNVVGHIQDWVRRLNTLFLP